MNRCEAIDASYLVEPEPGLWLLMLDSNVYQPKTGGVDIGSADAFIDSKHGKWRSVVRHRPYLLAWMADVRRRADRFGKTLLVCSHYAMLPIGDPHPAEEDGCEETAASLAKTGIDLHFSGHSHVCNVSRWSGEEGQLVDVAIPALCSFPPAFRVIEASEGAISVETVVATTVPGFDAPFAAYAAEARQDADLLEVAASLTAQTDYPTFVSRQLEVAVSRAMAARHFGTEFASLARCRSVAECLASLGCQPPAGPYGMRLMDAVCDWYRLSRAGQAALPFIPPARISAYCEVASLLAGTSSPNGEPWRRIRALLLQLADMASRPYAVSLRFQRGMNSGKT